GWGAGGRGRGVLRAGPGGPPAAAAPGPSAVGLTGRQLRHVDGDQRPRRGPTHRRRGGPLVPSPVGDRVTVPRGQADVRAPQAAQPHPRPRLCGAGLVAGGALADPTVRDQGADRHRRGAGALQRRVSHSGGARDAPTVVGVRRRELHHATAYRHERPLPTDEVQTSALPTRLQGPTERRITQGQNRDPTAQNVAPAIPTDRGLKSFTALPGGATDRTQGFRYAPPLAKLGRPSGAAKTRAGSNT